MVQSVEVNRLQIEWVGSTGDKRHSRCGQGIQTKKVTQLDKKSEYAEEAGVTLEFPGT